MTANPQPKQVCRFVETNSSRHIGKAIETASKVPLVVSFPANPALVRHGRSAITASSIAPITPR